MNINESQLKTVLKEQREEYQRYLGAVAEDFKSNLQLIAKSTSDLQKQLVALREMIARNTEDIEIIKTDIGLIKYGLKEKLMLMNLLLLKNAWPC